MRVIKRYSNRKLYDTADKRYVTLDQIATLVREGEEIKVVDNESGEDLTSVTLQQILVEQEKRKEGGLPKNILTSLVRGSFSVFEEIRRSVSNWLSAAHVSEEAIERNLDEMVKKGQLSLDEAKKLRDDVVERARDILKRVEEEIEKRVTEFLQKLEMPTKEDVAGLKKRLDLLAKKYEAFLIEIERRRGAATAGGRPAPGPGPAPASRPAAAEGDGGRPSEAVAEPPGSRAAP